MRRDEAAQQVDAFLAVQVDHVDAVLAQPVDAALEGLRLADDDGAGVDHRAARVAVGVVDRERAGARLGEDGGAGDAGGSGPHVGGGAYFDAGQSCGGIAILAVVGAAGAAAIAGAEAAAAANAGAD